MRRSNKDILIGYIGTLTDEEARKAWYILQDLEVPPCEWLMFDKVKLSCNQYNKLVFMWGEDKAKKCIDILNKWLDKKNITKQISHYHNLIGWVEQEYIKLYPADKDIDIMFDSHIASAKQAKRYIDRIPKELRAYDTEVKFLVEKFGTKILN